LNRQSSGRNFRPLADQRAHLVLDRDIGLGKDAVGAELLPMPRPQARRPAMTIFALGNETSADVQAYAACRPVITATCCTAVPILFSLLRSLNHN